MPTDAPPNQLLGSTKKPYFDTKHVSPIHKAMFYWFVENEHRMSETCYTNTHSSYTVMPDERRGQLPGNMPNYNLAKVKLQRKAV